MVLPAPLLGDSLTQQVTRSDQQTRGLVRRIYKDGTWYDGRQYEYTFKYMTAALKDDLIELVQTAGADYVTIIDHLSQEKEVLIVEVSQIQEMHNDECSYTVTLTLQEIL